MGLHGCVWLMPIIIQVCMVKQEAHQSMYGGVSATQDFLGLGYLEPCTE